MLRTVEALMHTNVDETSNCAACSGQRPTPSTERDCKHDASRVRVHTFHRNGANEHGEQAKYSRRHVVLVDLVQVHHCAWAQAVFSCRGRAQPAGKACNDHAAIA